MFDANGTEGLELFTWVVAGLIGLVAAVTFGHYLLVNEEDRDDAMPLEDDDTTK